MDSPNAVAWNATLNGTATAFNVIPLFMIIIAVFAIIGYMASVRGYG